MEAPRPGPVRVAGEVLGGIRRDVTADQTVVTLRPLGQTAGRVTCVVNGSAPLLPGDTVDGIGRAQAPSVVTGARGRPVLLIQAGALRIARGPPSWRRLTERCRLMLERSLLNTVSGVEGVLLCHLVLGHGPTLDGRVVSAHRATGLSHLLAVSGAHASMLGFMLGAAFAAISGKRGEHSRRYRWFCAVFLTLYGGITGMEPPVFRALVGLFVVMFARAQGRSPTICAVLALPTLLTTIAAPCDLLSASFCLSYTAVAGLALSGAFDWSSWRQRLVTGPLLGSCWATLLTMPLTLHYFGQVAPWTILATPVLAPLVAAMLAAGLAISALGLALPGVAAAAGHGLREAAAIYLGAVDATSSLPFAPIIALSSPGLGALTAAGMVGLGLFCWRPGRRGVAALAVCLSAPHFVPNAPLAPRLELLAVGHGQACLIVLDDHTTALVDCGSLMNETRAARAATTALAPARSLDHLIVTHADHDHAGSIPELLQRVRVRHAVLPIDLKGGGLAGLITAHGADITWVAPGDQLNLTTGIDVSRPVVRSDAVNDQSLWVRCEVGGTTALVPGDPLEAGVAAWIASPGLKPTDVLVLPHHGRPNELTRALLEAVQPRLALVSNRRSRSWSAQAEVAMQLGVRTLETGRVGTITVAGDDVETERSLRLR